MFKSYLSPKFFYICGLISIFLFWIFEFHIFVLWLSILGIIVFLFKKNDIGPVRILPSTKETYLSPINGIVKNIKHDVIHPVFGKELIEIRFILPFIVEMGLYLPCASEVLEIKGIEGMPFFRFGDFDQIETQTMMNQEIGLSGVILKLKGLKGINIGLKILQCSFGFFPRVWVMAGDRGEIGANIGYLPMGGAIFMYLPKGSVILVKESDHVQAGQTIIGEFQPC